MTQQLNISLDQLGLTPEIVAERVVDSIVDQLTSVYGEDEDGRERSAHSPFLREMEKRIKAAVDAKVAALAEAHLVPRINDMVENLVLQETNKWGEKTGKPLTFIEYLTMRADAYLKEPTDHWGKAKGESNDPYNWKATTTRLTGLLHEHLQYSIKTAMENALKELNASIAGGLEGAVRLKLQEITGNIKIVATHKN